MKAVSQIVGVLIALALLIPVVFAFLSLERNYERQYLVVMRGYREKLELIPRVNDSSIYVSIINPGPVEPIILRYVILKNISDGRIVWIKEIDRAFRVGDSMDIVLFNTLNITGKYDIMAVTLDGGVFHLDPEFTGFDGLLDRGDVLSIINQTNITNIYYYVNPAVGFAFNKSFVIEDLLSSKIYYLLPYLSVDSPIPVDVGYVVVNGPLYLVDNYNGKEIVAAYDDPSGLMLLYADGSTRVIPGSSVFDVDWSLSRSFSFSGSFYSCSISYEIGVYRVETYWSGSVEYLRLYTSNNVVEFHLQLYSGAYVQFIRFFGKLYFDGSVLGSNVTFLNAGSYDKYGLVLPFSIPKEYFCVLDRCSWGFDLRTGNEFLLFMYPGQYPVVRMVVNETYLSYDTYRPLVKLNSGRGTINPYFYWNAEIKKFFSLGYYSVEGSTWGFVRPVNTTYYVKYPAYLFPGWNNYTAEYLYPEFFVLNISDANAISPPWLLLVNSYTPLSVLDIGGDLRLTRYGIVNYTSVLYFKYPALVIVPGPGYLRTYYPGYGPSLAYVLMRYISSGTSIGVSDIVLSDASKMPQLIVVIPLDGPCKGVPTYLYVGYWHVLRIG